MSKQPLSAQNTFSPVAPPWSLTQLDSNFSAVYSALDDYGLLNTFLLDTSGAANAITVTPVAGLTMVLQAGLALDIQMANTTTSTTVTLNANGTGAKAVLLTNGAVPSVGCLLSGNIYRFIYDGTAWRVQNPTKNLLLTAFKPTFLNRNNLVTPTNDPDLQIVLPYAGTWMIQFFTSWGLASNSTGFQANLNFNGTQVTGNYCVNNSPTALLIADPPPGAAFSGYGVVTNAASTWCFSGVGQTVVSSSGTLALAWAQWGPSPSSQNVALTQGSWLTAQNVA